MLIIGWLSQAELSDSQYIITSAAVAVSRIGAIFIDWVINGETSRGVKSQLIAAPLITAPKARFRVGVIKGVPFSSLRLGAGWLDM